MASVNYNKLWAVAKTLAFLILFAYFATRVGHSISRLKAARIGTSTTFNHSRTVLYPAISLCPMAMDEDANLITNETILNSDLYFNASELLIEMYWGWVLSANEIKSHFTYTKYTYLNKSGIFLLMTGNSRPPDTLCFGRGDDRADRSLRRCAA